MCKVITGITIILRIYEKSEKDIFCNKKNYIKSLIRIIPTNFTLQYMN